MLFPIPPLINANIQNTYGEYENSTDFKSSLSKDTFLFQYSYDIVKSKRQIYDTQIITHFDLFIIIDMAKIDLTESEEDTRNFLINLALFDTFNVDELDILAKHMSYVHLRRGEYLFVEGDKGNFMGFVVAGVLEVLKKSETGESIIIARLTRGSSIGEMAIIDRSPRSATVVASQPATMVTLTDRGFELLAEKSPALGIKLIQKTARLLSLNMRRTSSKLADLLQGQQ